MDQVDIDSLTTALTQAATDGCYVKKSWNGRYTYGKNRWFKENTDEIAAAAEKALEPSSGIQPAQLSSLKTALGDYQQRLERSQNAAEGKKRQRCQRAWDKIHQLLNPTVSRSSFVLGPPQKKEKAESRGGWLRRLFSSSKSSPKRGEDPDLDDARKGL